MIFDTHAHYDDERYDADRDDLLGSMAQKGVGLILNASSDIKTSRASVELTKKYDFIYAAVGIHPHEVGDAPDDYIDILRGLCREKKVVAIGEIGLDYHYDFWPKEQQKQVFERQLELACELDMPVVIHEREAVEDCLEIVRRYDFRGEFHCYSGSWETARELLGRGLYLGFGGAVTFKKAKKPLEVIKNMPLDRLLVETDCPYMTPEPFRGKRNDSTLIPYVLAKMAEILERTPEEVERITLENGRRLFLEGVKEQ